MKGLSLDVLRAGKKYRLINFGEKHDFIIENILANGDFEVKDLHTLERYRLLDLVRYGKDADFEIRELELFA
ncbi:MAG: hypothetical protein O9340_02010 [Cyclobacteriaceae bacterium]|jgi:hypothetical protein|nr:hypothetical protein [Cyclobacteriaceae bacterium]